MLFWEAFHKILGPGWSERTVDVGKYGLEIRLGGFKVRFVCRLVKSFLSELEKRRKKIFLKLFPKHIFL